MSVQPRVRWFGEKERDKIVEEAVEVLERIGVFVRMTKRSSSSMVPVAKSTGA